MKKKFLCLLVIIVAMQVSVFAQVFKSYSDYENGYSGSSVANYQGIRSIDEARFIHNNMKISTNDNLAIDIHKLSKEENFLLNKALNEYDYEDGECYTVLIMPD